MGKHIQLGRFFAILVLGLWAAGGVYARAQAQISGFAPYGPPSNFQALDAFNALATDLILQGREGRPVSEAEMSTSAIALDLNLSECVWTQQPKINPAENRLATNWGYLCRFNLVAMNEPAFDTIGFFIHDGIDWRYFGRVESSVNVDNVVLADFHKLRQQPLAISPYSLNSQTHYRFRDGYDISKDPYGTAASIYWKDPYDADAKPGETTRNGYERLNNPTAKRLDDAIENPRGTEFQKLPQ